MRGYRRPSQADVRTGDEPAAQAERWPGISEEPGHPQTGWNKKIFPKPSKMEEDVAVTGGGACGIGEGAAGRLERCRQVQPVVLETASLNALELQRMLPGAGPVFSSRWSVGARQPRCQYAQSRC